MISLIAAIGKNRELGKDNKLLWHLPDDLKRFKELTNGHPIIMGRKTFDSIGRVLPNRTNIVITRNKELSIKNQENVRFVSSLEDAIEVANTSFGNEEVFVIGGGQIFEQAMKIAEKLYLTIVDREYDADAFFPEYEPFSHIAKEEKSSYDGLGYTFLDLEKPKNA